MRDSFTFKACLAPLTINPPQGASISVPCGKCSWCVRNRRNDLAGRAIVECDNAAYVCMVTATYRNNPDGSMPDGALDFIPDHLSRFIRAERKRGKLPPGGLRYLATGERGPNGSKRCHYHALLIFKAGRPPHWPSVASSKDRVHLASWPHGHVTISESPDHKRLARYVAYYAYKFGPDTFEETPDGPRKLYAGPFFSRNPVLGHDFAVSAAHEWAAKGLVPHDAGFSMKGQSSLGLTGNFYFRGTLQGVFVSEYVQEWRRLYGSGPIPSDFIMSKYHDLVARKEMAAAAVSSLDAEILSRRRPPASSIQFDLDEQDAAAFSLPVSDVAMTRCRLSGRQAVLTARSDKTALLEVAGMSAPFHLASDPDAPARQQLLRCGLSYADARALGRWLNKHWWASECRAADAERKANAARVARRRNLKASRRAAGDPWGGSSWP